jgi:phage shock protein A
MFRRISNLFRGFLSLFIGGLERRNPEALLEIEKENLRKQVAQYNQGLASHAGMCERLISQIRRFETEERDTRAQTGAQLRAGNREAAGQYAVRLQTVQRELGENRKQLEDAEKTYKELIRARDISVKTAQKKIEDLKYALSDLKIKKATAELAEMAGGMVSTIGGSGDTLDRLHGMIEDEREKAAGKARVAKDSLDLSGVHIKESEQKAIEQQALADFAAAEGYSLDGKPAALKPGEPAVLLPHLLKEESQESPR